MGRTRRSFLFKVLWKVINERPGQFHGGVEAVVWQTVILHLAEVGEHDVPGYDLAIDGYLISRFPCIMLFMDEDLASFRAFCFTYLAIDSAVGKNSRCVVIGSSPVGQASDLNRMSGDAYEAIRVCHQSFRI